jgi:3D (Asp-Asp-Asp) domain-containing protein
VKPLILAASALALCACTTAKWPEEDPGPRGGKNIDPGWAAGRADQTPSGLAGRAPGEPTAVDAAVTPVAAAPASVAAGDDTVYRNTYYDFPREGSGDKDATLYDATCAPIAKVTRAFHDKVCVQGSGALGMGQTVSFAKRDCACAAVCPRTGQKICFERLDPARFPHGRGATGGPITPFLTVAVDVSVIPLGTRLFVPELVGLPRADGSPHDGCFIAEDRGLKVVGRHLDIFTGDPSMTAQWNARFPSNKGVHVRVGDPRCAKR